MCGLNFMDLGFIDYMESAMAHNVPDILSPVRRAHTHGIFNAGTSILSRRSTPNTQLLYITALVCRSHASQSVLPSTI